MKQRPNAWINIAAFVASVLSVLSGIVLWLMPSGGYRGGRGLAARPLALGLSHDVWYDIHVWGSLALVALVIVHLVAHWCWIRKLPKFLGLRPRKTTAAGNPVAEDICDSDAVPKESYTAESAVADEDPELCETAAW